MSAPPPEPSTAAPTAASVIGAADAAWAHHAALTVFTFLWGSNFVLAEVALREMAPLAFSVSRFAMGGAALVGLLYGSLWRGVARGGRRGRLRLLPALSTREWPRFVAVAVFGAMLAPWLGIEGLGRTYATRAAFWLALAPAASALCGAVLRTERIGRYGAAGLALAVLGTVGLAFDGLRPGRGYGAGDALLAASVVFAVVELHLVKPLAARYGAIPIVTARTVLGGTLYLLVALPTLAAQPWGTLGAWTWIAIVAGGAVGVGVGGWVKVRALRPLGPTQVVIYGNLVPLATLLIAWLTIGERSTVLEVGAGILIVLGAVLLHLGGAHTDEAIEATHT